MNSSADSGPNFLLDWHESANSRRYWRAGAGSLMVHAGILALVFFLASLSGPAPKEYTQIVPDFSQAVHLVLPSDLTQKAPNKGKVAKEVNVEDLKPRPPTQERLPPAPAVRAFKPPNPQPPGSPADRAAAHCRTSENRDARHGAERPTAAARAGWSAESSTHADSARGATQARF